jgi:hypothetical protein
MELILTDPTTRIAISAMGTGPNDKEAYLFMVGIEVQYTPTGGGSSTTGTAVTTTNFINMILAGILDSATLADPWAFFSGAALAVRNVSFTGTFKVFNLWFQISYLPIELRVSTENVLDVSADVQGIETIGDGTGALIENPADIIEDIMLKFLGFVAGDLDATSFAAAQTDLVALGAVFGFALLEERDGMQLNAELAYQARCWFRAEGNVYKLDVRSSILPASDRSLITTGVTGRLPGTGKLSPLGLAGVSNRVIVKYAEDYSADSDDPFTELARAEDGASQTLYGVREKIIEAFAIRDPAYAQNFASFLIAQEPNPRNLYSLKTSISNLDLERGDILAATDARWGMSAAKGELVGISYMPGSATQKRPHTLDLILYLEPYKYYWQEATGEAGIIITGTTTTGGTTGGGGTGGIIGIIDPLDGGGGDDQPIFRTPQTGAFYIRGIVIKAVLPAAGGHPIYWDAARQRWQFALSDNTTLIEFDRSGNLYVPTGVMHHQTLTYAGAANQISSDATVVWFNAGNTRVAEIRAADGYLRVVQTLVPNAKENQLL